jgi:hypothetical protein
MPAFERTQSQRRGYWPGVGTYQLLGSTSDLWVERDVAALIGCKREGGRIVRKLGAFNYFTGMTGKGGARAPVLYNGKEFRSTFIISRKNKTAFTEVATRTKSGSNSAVIH